MSIGSRIRELRKELKLTQDEFASKIGVHGRQFSRYEVGVNTPSAEILSKIADYCEVSIDYIVYGENKKLAKRTKINDNELLELTRKIDRLKRPARERIKWALKSFLIENP